MNQLTDLYMANYLQRFGVMPRVTDIEVLVNDTNGRYQLPDTTILSGKIIVGLRCSVQEQIGGVDTVFTPLGRTIVSQTVINDAYLTLQSDSLRFIENIPLKDHVPTIYDRTFTALDNIRGFNPTKSVIEIGNPAAPAGKLVAGTAFLLHFYYLD